MRAEAACGLGECQVQGLRPQTGMRAESIRGLGRYRTQERSSRTGRRPNTLQEKTGTPVSLHDPANCEDLAASIADSDVLINATRRQASPRPIKDPIPPRSTKVSEKAPGKARCPEKKAKRTNVRELFSQGQIALPGAFVAAGRIFAGGKDPQTPVYFSVHQARFSSGTRTLISWFLTPTRALAGMECVTKAEPPMMDPAPTTVSPPKTEALE